jgi:hypothetical protein
MGAAVIQYTTNSGTVTFSFQRGPKDFIAEDSARRHDNVATSGLRESVLEFIDILIAFTMPGILMGGDYTDWKNFYAWALAGGEFSFYPNYSVTVAAAPWSGSPYAVHCVLEDMGFKPKRVGFWRYSIDCKFRVVPDTYAPPNSGWIMEAFMGLTPS